MAGNLEIMPKPGEHKTVQARILAYAEASTSPFFINPLMEINNDRNELSNRNLRITRGKHEITFSCPLPFRRFSSKAP